MGNIGKETLTPDIQLTFTYFLKKFFFWQLAFILGSRGSNLIVEGYGRIYLWC